MESRWIWLAISCKRVFMLFNLVARSLFWGETK